MSIGPGYACVSCKTYLRPRKNDIYVQVNMITNSPSGEAPYQVWNADLWECPDCGHQVILGYGKECCSEHYQDGFDDWLKLVTHKIVGPLKGLT